MAMDNFSRMSTDCLSICCTRSFRPKVSTRYGFGSLYLTLSDSVQWAHQGPLNRPKKSCRKSLQFRYMNSRESITS